MAKPRRLLLCLLCVIVASFAPAAPALPSGHVSRSFDTGRLAEPASGVSFAGLFWKSGDVRLLDPWGDAADPSRDIIAVYSRVEGDYVHLRVDLMDLSSGGGQNIYLAIDCADGGSTRLESGKAEGVTDAPWDVLLKSQGPGNGFVYGPGFESKPELMREYQYDSSMDYVEFVIAKSALPDWGGGAFLMQAISSPLGADSVSDKTDVAKSDADTSGNRAKLIIEVANAFINDSPFSIGWYEGFSSELPGRDDQYSGSKYILDAVEKYRVPIALEYHPNLFPGGDYFRINHRLIGLANQGLIDLPETLMGALFMPFRPDDVLDKAFRLAEKSRVNMGFPASNLYFPYEGILKARDVEFIKNAGFQVIYGLDRFHYYTGGWITDWGDPAFCKATIEAGKKIHRINGLNMIFHTGVGNYWGFSSDERWGQVTYPSEIEAYTGTDNGLHTFFRRILHDLAVDPDQEKFYLLGTDIQLIPWLYQDAVENNFKWIAMHPWIEAVTFTNLASRNWTPVDHGQLPLSSEEWLQRFYAADVTHYNDYLWEYYYGGASDGRTELIPAGTPIEGYFNYVPYLRDARPIPSGRNMGDHQTPGTMICETVNNLRGAPDNALGELAWRFYLNTINEQTFHISADNSPGGPFMDPTMKSLANYVGQVNKVVAAAKWADEVAKGSQGPAAQAVAQDLDLDGEDEYVLKNDKVFAVFENDGGRLQFAFAYDAAIGPVQIIGPAVQTTAPMFQASFEDGELAYSKDYGVFSAFYDNADTSVYHASPGGDSLAFSSEGNKVVKKFTLQGNTISAAYSVSGDVSIYFAFMVNLLDTYQSGWADRISKIDEGEKKGWKSSAGGYGYVNLEGTTFYNMQSFLDSPARREMKNSRDLSKYPQGHWYPFPMCDVMVNGSNSFNVSLTLSAGVYPN